MYSEVAVLKIAIPSPGDGQLLPACLCWDDACTDAGTSGPRPKKQEATSRVDYDKVICSMSEWVAGRTFGGKRRWNLHSKEESASSQRPWGTLGLCQNFWLDVMQSLSRATSAKKMFEWWSKMCWRKHWQHEHGQILRPGELRNHFSRAESPPCVHTIHKTLLLLWTVWVNPSSVCSTLDRQKAEWTAESTTGPESSPNNMQMGLFNACLHICGIVHD